MSNFFTMGASILALVSLVNQAQAMTCAQSNAQTAEAGKLSELEKSLTEAEQVGKSHKDARWEDKRYERPAEVTKKLTETRARLAMLGSSTRIQSRIEKLEWDLAVTPRTLNEHAIKARELAFLRIELIRHRLAELALYEDFFDRLEYSNLQLPQPGIYPGDGISQVRVAMHQARQRITTEIRARANELLDRMAEYRRENVQAEPSRLARWASSWLGRPIDFDPYKIAEQMGFEVRGLRSRVNLISASIQRFLNTGAVNDLLDDIAGSRAYFALNRNHLVVAAELGKVPTLSTTETIELMGLKPDGQTFQVNEFSASGQALGIRHWGAAGNKSNLDYGLPTVTPKGQFVELPSRNGFVRFEGVIGQGSEAIVHYTFRRVEAQASFERMYREQLVRAYLIAMIYGGYGDPSIAIISRIREEFRAGADERGILTEARSSRFSELWDSFGQYLADNGLLISPYNVSNKSHLVFLESGRPNVLRIMGSAWDQSPESLIRGSTSRRDLRIGPIRVLSSHSRRIQFVVDIELPE
ncbi:MAG: hypothetical protein IT288_18135 [Bdellovibrionales bacterium]|nr:hypothetical protein [Bdellovibrionales bacterium]